SGEPDRVRSHLVEPLRRIHDPVRALTGHAAPVQSRDAARRPGLRLRFPVGRQRFPAHRLAPAGATLDDVVKLVNYVTDLSLREEANEQLLAAFSDPRPARTFVEVSGLPYGSTVEI